MINVHIEFNETRHAWFVAREIPPCQFKVIPRVNESTWLNSVIAEYWEPFNLTRGPLIRFLFIQGPEVSELVAFAQHSICDGLSLVYLLRDFMILLGSPDSVLPPRTHVPTINEVVNLDTIKINPLIKKIFLKFNALWAQQKVILTAEDFSPIHVAFQNHTVNAITWTLTPDTTLALMKKCHDEGISVNSVLYAAILNAQHTLQGDAESFRNRIMMPVNLRRFISPAIEEVVGLYAGGDMFEIKLNWKTDFWKQAHKVHQKLVKGITPKSMFSQAKRMMLVDPSIMDARTMLFMGSLLPAPPPKYQELVQIISRDRFLSKLRVKNTTKQIQFGTILTNLGKVQIPEKFGLYRLQEVIFLPPSSPAAEKLIGVVTFNNCLQGTIAFAEKTLDANLAISFARKLEEFIQKII